MCYIWFQYVYGVNYIKESGYVLVIDFNISVQYCQGNVK